MKPVVPPWWSGWICQPRENNGRTEGNIRRLVGKGLAVYRSHLVCLSSVSPPKEMPAPESRPGTWRPREEILRSTISALLASRSRYLMGEWSLPLDDWHAQPSSTLQLSSLSKWDTKLHRENCHPLDNITKLLIPQLCKHNEVRLLNAMKFW